MTLPANIRVNAMLPFPALVTGTGPITIGKVNGIWQVGFTINAFGSQNPPLANYPTDFVLAYDVVNKTFFKVSLASLGIGGARTQRSVTATPIVIASTDQILNCNINVAAACALPAAATRNGVPLTFKDLGQATAHNITLTPDGAETIDGATIYKLTANYQWVTLVPFNDGVNSGWMVQ